MPQQSCVRIRLGDGDWGESAPLVPSHRDEVEEAAAKPVPDAVFGPARDSWPVVDHGFADLSASALDEDGEEPVEPVEPEHQGQCGSGEHPDGATGVAEAGAQGDPARPGGKAGGDAPQPCVLPAGADALDKVIAGQLAEQAREVGGIVLEIAIEGGEDAAAGGLKPGPEGGALARLAAEAEPANPGIALAGVLDGVPRPVAAAVVDKDDLVFDRFGVESGMDLRGEALDVVGFVEERHHDR